MTGEFFPSRTSLDRLTADPKHLGFHATALWKNKELPGRDPNTVDVSVWQDGLSPVDPRSGKKVAFVTFPSVTVDKLIAQHGGYPLSSEFWRNLSFLAQRRLNSSTKNLVYAPPVLPL